MTEPIEGREILGSCSPDSFNTNPELVRLVNSWFFEEEDGKIIAHAKSICRECPARIDCLEQGLHEPYGIRGGLTADERRRLRKELRNA
jgi:hypothetical protein